MKGCAAGSRMGLRHLVWRLREEFYPERHPYDALTGCDTSGMIHHRRLGPEAEDYQPIDPDIFRAALAHIDEDFSQFIFIDLGCGKGRALLLAEEFDFQKIIGVEFSQPLTKIAAANAAKVGSHRIFTVNTDVRQFQFPPGPLIVFLYNPFSGGIFRAVMDRLRTHQSTLYIVYVNPVHGEVMSADGRMKIAATDEWCTVWKRRNE
jgi:SAM-dependent methyltransferase